MGNKILLKYSVTHFVKKDYFWRYNRPPSDGIPLAATTNIVSHLILQRQYIKVNSNLRVAQTPWYQLHNRIQPTTKTTIIKQPLYQLYICNHTF